MIWKNIFVGILLILITILIHSAVTRYIIHLVNKKKNPNNKLLNRTNEFWVVNRNSNGCGTETIF